MRRMSKLASILDKSILADDEGNIETKKDVKIDGNLKFKSLVSGDNPEGIFDPSSGGTGGGGGGNLYHHALRIKDGSTEDIVFDIYNKQSEQLTFATLKTALIDTQVSCSGYRSQSGKMWHALRLYLANHNTDIHVDLYTIDAKTAASGVGNVGSPSVLTDLVSQVI